MVTEHQLMTAIFAFDLFGVAVIIFAGWLVLRGLRAAYRYITKE